MKQIIIILSFVFLAVFLNSCRFYEKRRLFSKDYDTLLDAKYEKPLVSVNDSTKIRSEKQVTKVPEQTSQPALGFGYGSDKYYIIVGSFLNQNSAERYADKIQQMGYHTQIIQSVSGYYRVSAQSYHSLKQAINDVPEFREKIASNAWLHVRK